MNLLFFGHSLVTRRQWSFVKTLDETTSLEVIYFPPNLWGKHMFQGEGHFQEVGLIDADKGLFGYYYDPNYILDKIDLYNADIIGGFVEPYSMAGKVLQMCANKTGVKTVFFAYENLSNNFLNYSPTLKNNYSVIKEADYILCGNKNAQRFMKTLGAKDPQLVPHSGVEPEFFFNYSNNKPYYEGIFLSRDVPEKGWWLVDEYLFGRVHKPSEFIPEPEIPLFYNSGRVFVVASLRTPNWVEQLCYVIAEALSCERAVIMSKYGSQVDWFSDAPGVITYDPHDEESMNSAFDHALNYYPNKKGREWILENFSNEVIAKRWEKILK